MTATTELFPYPATDHREPRRGRFHFSPQAGWMNDPNGLVYYRGTYHLYFQHNPHSLEWDTMHWGHATSPDLVHWTQQPIALHPDVHPGALFSGGGVVDVTNTSGLATAQHDPIVVFTGTQGVRAMVSLDGGDTFEPLDDGRVLATPPGRESRDPKVFRHEPSGKWVMVVWSDDDGNGVNFFGSPDLREWTFLSRFAADWMFECPDVSVMALDGDPGELRHVLVSASGGYLVGDFDGLEFVPAGDRPQHVTRHPGGAGSDYYAAQTFSDAPDGRVVSVAWQGRNRGPTWTGNLSFPVEQRLLSSADGVHVHSEPVAEIALLHREVRTEQDVAVTAAGLRIGADPSARDTDGLDVEVAVDRARSSARQLILEAVVPGGCAETITAYDLEEHGLDGHPLPAAGQAADAAVVRVLVDRDQVAVFAAGGRHYVAVNRALEDPERTAELRLRADGGDAVLSTLTVRRLGASWS
ncbi:hypothetical protein [Isoptericola sp. NPDC055881]